MLFKIPIILMFFACLITLQSFGQDRIYELFNEGLNMMADSKYEEAMKSFQQAEDELKTPNAIPNPSLVIRINELRLVSEKCLEIKDSISSKSMKNKQDSVDLRNAYINILNQNYKDKVIRKELNKLTTSTEKDCNSFYETAKTENQIPLWISFLDVYPDCELAGEARDFLELAYLEKMQSGDLGKYNEYLASYCSGKYRQDAINQIEKNLWGKALEYNDPNSYKEYLSYFPYPFGLHSCEAYNKREELLWKIISDLTKKDKEGEYYDEYYRQYMKEYPAGKYYSLADSSSISGGRWKRTRYEALIGIGGSIFRGDMKSSICPLVFTGLRYKLMERHAIEFSLNYSKVSATDISSKDINLKNRNLNFISDIIEGSIQYEYSIVKERMGSRYTFGNMSRFKLRYVNTYLFAGIGAFYFNPKTKAGNGKYYDLQPLGTEGQGIDGTPDKYNRIQIAFPVGIGFKYGINRKSSLNLEFSYRFTSTDYIDDIHGNYYDNNAIKLANGDIAAELSDRRIQPDNNLRGNPKNNDGYFFFKIGFAYKLKTNRNGLPLIFG